jgi:predicted RNA-binding Zn ribbon-like protein
VIFAHDTEVSLAAMAALVNTLDGEQLPDQAALDAHLAAWRWSGSRTHDQAELDAVRALRSRLRQLWELPEDGVVALVNTLLRDAGARPQLVRHDGFDYHVHATPAQAPLADRMAVEHAMAMVDVVRLKELPRLRVCAAADCGRVMVDLSKNRSRRFCDPTCANRVNVAAFRARRSARGG